MCPHLTRSGSVSALPLYYAWHAPSLSRACQQMPTVEQEITEACDVENVRQRHVTLKLRVSEFQLDNIIHGQLHHLWEKHYD